MTPLISTANQWKVNINCWKSNFPWNHCSAIQNCNFDFLLWIHKKFSWNFDKHFFWRSKHRSYSVRKGVLRNCKKLTENICARVSFFYNMAGLRPVTLLKRGSSTGVFLWNISKNTFLTEHLLTTASTFGMLTLHFFFLFKFLNSILCSLSNLRFSICVFPELK